jgi:excisionase family DNA binding protein
MKFYTVEEIAEILCVNQETVRRWIRSGKLETTITSRKHGNRVSENDLYAFAYANPKYAALLRLRNTNGRYPREWLSIRLRELINERDYINRQIENLEYILSTMEEP